MHHFSTDLNYYTLFSPINKNSTYIFFAFKLKINGILAHSHKNAQTKWTKREKERKLKHRFIYLLQNKIHAKKQQQGNKNKLTS